MAKQQGRSSPILKEGEGVNLRVSLSQKLYYTASN